MKKIVLILLSPIFLSAGLAGDFSNRDFFENYLIHEVESSQEFLELIELARENQEDLILEFSIEQSHVEGVMLPPGDDEVDSMIDNQDIDLLGEDFLSSDSSRDDSSNSKRVFIGGGGFLSFPYGLGAEVNVTPRILWGTPVTISVRGASTGILYTLGGDIQLNLVGLLGVNFPVDFITYVGFHRTQTTGLASRLIDEDQRQIAPGFSINTSLSAWTIDYGIGLELKSRYQNSIYLRAGFTEMLGQAQLVDNSNVAVLESFRIFNVQAGFRIACLRKRCKERVR